MGTEWHCIPNVKHKPYSSSLQTAFERKSVRKDGYGGIGGMTAASILLHFTTHLEADFGNSSCRKCVKAGLELKGFWS
jgi:hypothetical protein